MLAERPAGDVAAVHRLADKYYAIAVSAKLRGRSADNVLKELLGRCILVLPSIRQHSTTLSHHPLLLHMQLYNNESRYKARQAHTPH
jgi:hypothetical protein